MKHMAALRAAAVLSLVAFSCKTPSGSKIKASGEAPATAGIGADGRMTVDAMIQHAQDRTAAGFSWPDKDHDWREQLQPMDSVACQDFKKFIFPGVVNDDNLPEERQALRSDAMVVIKNGVIVFENYVGPYEANHKMLHPMWSASKSFSASFFGALAQASADAAAGIPSPTAEIGQRLNAKLGHPFTVETKLKELFDPSVLNKSEAFANLTVRDFLTMAPNLKWEERYAGDVGQSSIVKMLWAVGAKDMAAFAARPITGATDEQQFGSEGAGNKFIYSSGNAVILMRALKGVFEGDDYTSLPWKALFDRVGMSQVVFERDPAGTFIGSSYVHTNLRDMARFGFALLNGGYYKDQQVIHKDFVQNFRDVAPVELKTTTSEDDVLKEQGFYGMGFYINPDPKMFATATPVSRTFSDNFYSDLKKPPYSSDRFFPHMTTDMFMAAGHYGQNILIFPQEDLMVVRMSHDREYWTKIDAMASKAKQCFLTDGTVAGVSPQFPPAGTPAAPTLADAISKIKVSQFAIETGMFNTLFAKELCTCMYVDGMGMNECKARDNLPSVAHLVVRFTPSTKITDPAAPKVLKSQYVGSTLLRTILMGLGISMPHVGPAATARYVDDKVGCVLDPAAAG